MSELKEDIEKQLRTLRAADTQAKAVAWMTSAYTLLERCLKEIEDGPVEVVRERLVFVPERPKLTIVQSLPANPLTPIYSKPPVWFAGQTVVYPDQPLPFKSAPKPWTRRDTLRLEAATRATRPPIQRRGR